ncbi:MAG TPA: GNAT family N-acetyltransferase [Archangium sp.]|nr:GNAT family N-acetyltransferase [Archangium sp.]
MDPVRIIEHPSPPPPAGAHSPGEALASQFVGHYVEHGTAAYIENTRHQVMLAVIDGEEVPLIINNGTDSRCYLTSSYVNYVLYAEDFARSVKARWARWALLFFISLVRLIIRPSHLDKAVYVNHWMVATGPALRFTPSQLERLAQALRKRFPDHALIFKRGTAETAAAMASRRSGPRFHSIFNRQMYVWRYEPSRKALRDFKADRNLLNQHLGNLRRLTTAEPGLIERMRELYQSLYIDKYSSHNAFLTTAWFEEAFLRGLLEIYGIELEGRLSFFTTCFVAGDELICSMVGHDPEMSRKHGLYRAGMSHMMMLAEQRGLTLNLSSGAGQFKQKRGCTTLAEHELLCFSHLPWRARLSWTLLSRIYNTVGPRVFSALSI